MEISFFSLFHFDFIFDFLLHYWCEIIQLILSADVSKIFNDAFMLWPGDCLKPSKHLTDYNVAITRTFGLGNTDFADLTKNPEMTDVFIWVEVLNDFILNLLDKHFSTYFFYFFIFNFFLVKLLFFKVNAMNFWIIPQLILFFGALIIFLLIKTNEVNYKVWDIAQKILFLAIIYQVLLIYLYHNFFCIGLDLKVGLIGLFKLPINLSYIKLNLFLLILLILALTISFLKIFYLKTLFLIKPELSSLSLFLGFGSGMVFLQNDLFSIFLYLEIISFCIYGFLFLQQWTNSQLHGLIRYVLFSLWMAAFYIVGLSLYLSWTNFNTSLSYLSYNNLLELSGLHNTKWISSFTVYLNPELVLSLFFFLMYFFFKLGAGPFYTWVIEVYNSSSTGVLFVVSIVPKLIYIPVLGFLLFFNFIKFYYYWSILLFIIGFLTLFIGSFGVLMTDKLKEIYAWSSIIHTGNILLILSCVNKISLILVFFYLIGYTISSCGFIMIILTLWNKLTGWFIKNILELSSINYLSSGFLIITIIILSSAAGFTPFLSFFMKFSLVSIISVNYGIVIALLVGILNIIGSIIYLKMLRNVIGYNLLPYKTWKKFKPYVPLNLQMNYKMGWFLNLLCLIICLGFFLYNEILYNITYIHWPLFLDTEINSWLDAWIKTKLNKTYTCFSYVDSTLYTK